MQAQHRPRYAWEEYYKFLGGYTRFDLWFDTEGDLRIVWGDSDSHWHYILAGQRNFGLNRDTRSFRDLVDKPTRAETLGIKHYLMLFAPDYLEALRIGRKKDAA